MEKAEVLKKIGSKISELRESRKMSLQDLCDKCDFEKPNLVRIEKGRNNLTIGTLLKICQGLDIRLVDIVDVE